jgi:hypothetical protein
MINFKTLLYNKLITITPKIYDEEAPTGTAYPYIVYNLPGSTDDYDRDDIAVDIDIWGYGTDNTAIDQLVADVRATFDNYTETNENIGVTFYYVSTLQIADPTEKVRRRRVRLLAATYYN